MNIIKLYNLKNLICIKNSHFNTNLFNILIFAKSISNLYLKLFIILKQHNLLIINTNKLYITEVKNILNISKLPFINTSKWIYGFLSNWEIIKKNIILYIWLYKIIYIFNILKINLKIKNILYLYKNFFKLHNKYVNLKFITNIPNYIFIINSKNSYSIIKESIKLNKSLIYITNNINIISICEIPIITKFNFNILELILKLIILAKIQSNI